MKCPREWFTTRGPRFSKAVQDNKLDTPFCPETYEVVDKRGSEVTVQSSAGERYWRNVTLVKKFHSESPQPITVDVPEESGEAQESSPSPESVLRRSIRECRVPKHLKDYELCL